MKPRQGQKGQAMIEAAIAMPIVLAAILSIGMMVYAALVYYSVDYPLHEALVCSTYQSRHKCEQDLRRRIDKVLSFGEIVNLNIRGQHATAQGKVTIRLFRGEYTHPLLKHTEFEFDKSVELPK